jgi:hypothetical protein
VLLERLAKHSGRLKARPADDAADLLYVLTGFATYDALATPTRSREEVNRLIRQLARQVLV